MNKTKVKVFRNGGVLRQNKFDLFDKIVLPILLYGSEVWGFEMQNKIESVHVKFCKYVLGVSHVTSNCAVMGECGRKSLHVFHMVR